jgi:hypothetical protein
LGPVARLGGKLPASSGSAKRRGPDEEETVMNPLYPFLGSNLKRPNIQQLLREKLKGRGFCSLLSPGELLFWALEGRLQTFGDERFLKEDIHFLVEPLPSSARSESQDRNLVDVGSWKEMSGKRIL